MRKIVLPLFLFFATIGLAQNEIAEEEIKITINSFFEGLHNGDTILVNKSINSGLKRQSAYYNKEGKSILRNESKANFFKTLAGKNPTDVWFEKLISFKILVDGNLASVWTPYEFYVNNKFSHCGVNSFQLFKSDENWEIIYLVDTKRRWGCEAFK